MRKRKRVRFSRRRSRKRRRRTRRKRGNKITYAKIGRQFPDQEYVIHHLHWEGKYNASSSGSQTLRLNGLTDVDASGAQPMMFDEQIIKFTNYTVRAAKIRFKVINLSAEAVECYLLARNGTSVPASIEDATTQKYAKFAVVPGNLSGKELYTFRQYINTHKLYGERMQSVNWHGGSSGNPNIQQNWIWGFNNIASASNVNLVVRVDIDYYVMWTHRKTPVSS